MRPSGVQTRRPSTTRARRGTSHELPIGPRWADLTQPGLRRLLIAAGALSLVTIGDGFLYLVLQDGGQIPNAYFPLLFVGTNLAYLSLAIPMGKLADRMGRGRVFVGGYLLLLCCYVIAGLNLGGIVGLLVVLLLLGAFYAATDGVLAALASLLVPRRAEQAESAQHRRWSRSRDSLHRWDSAFCGNSQA